MSSSQHPSPLSPSFSDDEEDHHDEEHSGDYSARMDAVLSDDDGGDHDMAENGFEDEDDEDEVFVYDGVDADENNSGTIDDMDGYKNRLKDILGQDADSEEEEPEEPIANRTADSSEQEVENSLIVDSQNVSTDSISNAPSSPRTSSPLTLQDLTPSKLIARPFLHPNVSRLRSYTPQQPSSLLASTSSVGTGTGFGAVGSPSPSHFSSMSRMSSISNLRDFASNSDDVMGVNGHSHSTKNKPREPFKWTPLRNISNQLFSAATNKAASVLGAPTIGAPTVLAANGLICVGTEEGKICVYDFKQTLKCVCGNEISARAYGPVTALALSFDHTFVAAGHISGHITLYNLITPTQPARLVEPTTLQVISSGRKEGHLRGSRIVSVGFVAGRHTALVSADEHGLAFYHSLGKVLFVEASDTLRILGKYPLDGLSPSHPSTPISSEMTAPATPITPTTPTLNHFLKKRKNKFTILGMAPLPLGPISHPTDLYNVIALLTPTKLVVVGLKPSPRTWFKCSRAEVQPDQEKYSGSRRYRGCLAWFPSVEVTDNVEVNATPKLNGNAKAKTTEPLLAFTWGTSLHLIKVFEKKIRTKQKPKLPSSDKVKMVDVGSVAYSSCGMWDTGDEDILGIQWLNGHQVVVVTKTTMQVYDANLSRVIEKIEFDGLSMVSPVMSRTVNGAMPYHESIAEVAHSLRVYKGKLFILTKQYLSVGTLLTWADRILSYVQEGDFLSAIELTRRYYTGDFEGNSNGLPDDLTARRKVVGQKIQELMSASARYAFSEDRMTDGTHDSTDGRGVDRTSLFEGLVTTCAKACVSMNDYDFLFEDLWGYYEDVGISSIFLTQLEPFVLDNEIHDVPPRITQRLVGLRAEQGKPELVERLIWHLGPECLDVDQVIGMCQRYGLYDALIYVYTRALKDYVAPVVELLGLMRQVRRLKLQGRNRDEDDEAVLEPLILNAYKVYPYLSNVLSGITYPSEEPLPEEEANQAKKDVYSFLFFGRSSVWPPHSGQLVLTADEDGAVEPTYPYARQLLRWDAESFLHCLDICFEDHYLNDYDGQGNGVSRMVIVAILQEIVSSGSLPPSDVTFTNIFIARNVPKYHQYLDHVAPSVLHGILISLAEDPDNSTLDDRQLAAEYLLSVYNPHDSDHIMAVFREAKFFRIIRTRFRQDREWASLLETFLDDRSLRTPEIFVNINEVLTTAKRFHKKTIPQGLIDTVSNSLPRLMDASVESTAALLEDHLPQLHEQALECSGDEDDEADRRKLTYLRYLLGRPPQQDNEYITTVPQRSEGPSTKVSNALRQLYITLQCRFFPGDVIGILQYLPSDMLDLDFVIEVCDRHGAYDAVIWAINARGDPMQALEKADGFEREHTLTIVEALSGSKVEHIRRDVERAITDLTSIGQIAIAVCLEHSQKDISESPMAVENIWFQLLSSQLNCVQTVSQSRSFDSKEDEQDKDISAFERTTINSLRSLVEKTFSSLMSIASTRAVSFPRLFKRLIDSTTRAHSTSGTGMQYTEFRVILTGMLETYRSEGDILLITKHLVDRDLFDTISEGTTERVKGWAPRASICHKCKRSILITKGKNATVSGGDEASESESWKEIVVSRTGTIYHRNCTPSS